MDRRLVFFLVVIGLVILSEVYSYFALRSLISEDRTKRYFSIAYVLQFVFLVYAWYRSFEVIQNGALQRSFMDNFYIGIAFTMFISKLVFVSGMLIQDVGRMIGGLIAVITNMFQGNQGAIATIPARRDFLTKSAIFLAGIPFTAMLYGITKGKYQYTLERLSLVFNDLPKAFNGLKVVQISDIHSGSFDSVEKVGSAIDQINALDPDLILFTGDLVNFEKDEINPYMGEFARLKARMGKFAILGNHDYYGYERKEDADKDSYWADFMSKYPKMGFQLLKNEHVVLEKEGEKIAICGVENWGEARFFQKYGDLDKSIAGLDNEVFPILMSHDPSHWDAKVLPHERRFPLTLSGHTHGMQFGIDIPGFKWSPAKYRYPQWSGLYEKESQYLYVNKGFGFLGFPGRVGMWPEITLLELQVPS